MDFDGFDWDKGNRKKCQKHGVSVEVTEGVFNRPVIILPDEAHSKGEQRFRAIGRTVEGRGMFIVFTLRRRDDEVLLRPISVRYMHSEEVAGYEKENPDF